MLVDIRSYNDFLAYHIPRSKPLQSFKKFPKNVPIILLCESGQKARDFANYYRQLNYHTYYLEGGIRFYMAMQKQQSYY